MRTVTYGAACSLDGFIAGPAGEIDWLHMSKDVQDYMASYWKGVDTIVMGRKTFDFAQAMGGGEKAKASAKRASRKKSADPFFGIRSFVFSRTLNPADFPDVEIVASDAGAFVRDLKRQPGRGICVLGGGELGCSLLAAGVVDEVGLNVHPVLLGSGVPLFRDAGRRVALELAESRVMDGGCVLMTYRVKGARD
jgi:dihydrofolate reductase